MPYSDHTSWLGERQWCRNRLTCSRPAWSDTINAVWPMPLGLKERGFDMRNAHPGYAAILLILAVSLASGATCPNLGVHPGVNTIFLQSDYGDKDSAAKIYISGLQDAIKKSKAFCAVEDLRAATYALDVAGVDTGDEHDRAALSVVLVSEKGALISHWVRLSSIDNVEKNAADDLAKVERSAAKAKRQH
jgi:hypothetical protein